MVLKDLWARLYADLDNVFQKDLTIESAFRFLLEREQAIATGEGSIANFYDKWFKGNWALNCDGRSVSREQDSERVAPASKAPSVVPKAFFGGSDPDPDSGDLSREAQIQARYNY